MLPCDEIEEIKTLYSFMQRITKIETLRDKINAAKK